MPLPRPARPDVLWKDMRAFLRQRPRHKWFAATFAVLIPLAILVVFWLDAGTGAGPPEQVIFVDSWPSNRTDAEIRAKQQEDLKARREAEEARRREFQRLDESLNRLGI